MILSDVIPDPLVEFDLVVSMRLICATLATDYATPFLLSQHFCRTIVWHSVAAYSLHCANQNNIFTKYIITSNRLGYTITVK